MANDKFNWKSLFIKETEAEKEKTQPVVETKTVVESKITFPITNTISSSPAIPNEILSKVVEMYDKGFESLNQSGYDFYEFFKAVMAIDAANPQSYIMAYTMASSMDKSVSKTSLLSSAEFYLSEISKVYTKFNEEGRRIKTDLISVQKHDKDKLQLEIKSIQEKIIALQAELEQKTKLLLNYDSANSGKLQEIEQKIMANDLAKDRIIQKISQVVSGINNHI